MSPALKGEFLTTGPPGKPWPTDFLSKGAKGIQWIKRNHFKKQCWSNWRYRGKRTKPKSTPLLRDACSLEGKLWKHSVLKSRDITLPKKVHLVKAGCESWTIKKADCWRIDAFKLWCWRRLLRVSWTTRISNQSILKEIKPEYSLEGLMLKVEAPVLWPPDAKSRLTGKDPDAGKDWTQEVKGTTEDKMVGCHHWLNGHEFQPTVRDGGRQGSLVCYSPWGRKESDMT